MDARIQAMMDQTATALKLKDQFKSLVFAGQIPKEEMPAPSVMYAFAILASEVAAHILENNCVAMSAEDAEYERDMLEGELVAAIENRLARHIPFKDGSNLKAN